MAESLTDILRAKLRAHLNGQPFGLKRFEEIHGMTEGAYKGFLDPSREQTPNLDKAYDLCKALGLDLRIVEPNDDEPRLEGFAQIGIDPAIAAAGNGFVNEDLEARGHLAFRRSWLTENGINPRRASVISVKGDSMAPTISDGAIVLIDQQRTEPKSNLIYALLDEGELRVKRVFYTEGKSIILYSDNSGFPPEARTGREMNSIRIIGQVMWSAQNMSEAVPVP